MPRFITHMRISQRLLLALLLAAAIPGIILALPSITFLDTQQKRSEAIQADIYALDSAHNTRSSIVQTNDLLKKLYQDTYAVAPRQGQAVQEHVSPQVATGLQSSDLQSQLLNATNEFTHTLYQYQHTYQLNTAPQMHNSLAFLQENDAHTTLPRQQQNLLKRVNSQLWPSYRDMQQQVSKALQARAAKDSVTSLFQNVQDKYTLLLNAWDTIISLEEEINIKVAQVSPSQNHQMLLFVLIAISAALLIVLAFSYIIYLTVIRPLHQLVIFTRRIANGETAARAKVRGKDEISTIAGSLNMLLDNIAKLLQESQQQHDSLQGQIEKLVGEVSGVGEGDLRIQAEVTGNALGVMADSFNYMIEELGSLVVRVKSVTTEVERSTTQIQERMKQLVETEETQLEQMTRAEEGVEQMSNSSRQVAEHAQHLLQIARIARQGTQVGRESVQQSIAGIEHISQNVQETTGKVQVLDERSREIDEIIEVIVGIAHQTNRLALDASIQAAIAGEHGKGFAAVASDIRRLAERAREQASKISQIVRSIREDISEAAHAMQETEHEAAVGARLSQDTGMALEAIFTAVEHQAREIEQITQMTTQQLRISGLVVRIMQQVSASTRAGSENTREASQNMERLIRRVEQLRSSVGVFKLRENHDYYIPTARIQMPFEEEEGPDSPLTVSGVFRRAGSISQPLRLNAGEQTLHGLSRSETPMPQAPSAAQPVAPFSSSTRHSISSVGNWRWPVPQNTEKGLPFQQEEQKNSG